MQEPKQQLPLLMGQILRAGKKSARVVYFNMMVERKGSQILLGELNELRDKAQNLFDRNKTFFYRDFLVEELVA